MLASQRRAAGAGRAAAPAPSRPLRARAVAVRAAKTADGPRIAIVGVTGAVGQEFLTVRGCVLRRGANQFVPLFGGSISGARARADRALLLRAVFLNRD